MLQYNEESEVFWASQCGQSWHINQWENTRGRRHRVTCEVIAALAARGSDKYFIYKNLLLCKLLFQIKNWDELCWMLISIYIRDRTCFVNKRMLVPFMCVDLPGHDTSQHKSSLRTESTELYLGNWYRPLFSVANCIGLEYTEHLGYVWYGSFLLIFYL